MASRNESRSRSYRDFPTFPDLRCLAYALVWLAIRLPAPFRRIGARNDYSYGIYIYGFLDVHPRKPPRAGDRRHRLPVLRRRTGHR
ncbi:hypothetical protein DF268_18615 [Streptomyces sp. V2]|nr:hypothetical protein DF268_18615 [Streptomyces sp. V2]